jgi:phage protein D/phage baseplate assembly protein gpV
MTAVLSPAGRENSQSTAEGIDILIGGATIGEEWLGRLLLVEVRDNLLLPDMALIHLRDPHGDHLTSNPLKLGAPVEIKIGSASARTTEKLFVGEIVALEHEFRHDEAILAARAFDKGHRLNRTKESRTYLNKKAEDIVREVAGRSGLQVGTVDSTSTVHQHLQQSQQTDWDLCWSLAHMNGFEFAVSEGKVVFRKRKAGSAAMTLTWKEDLLSFRPRASIVGQVSEVEVHNHDPKARQSTQSTASTAASISKPKIWNDRAKAIKAVGGGKALVADRVAASTKEAQSMAQGALNRNASAFIEADGTAFGSPKLRAGATVTIAGVGDFNGDYVLSSSVHMFRGGKTYITRFDIMGDRARSFAELVGAKASAGGGGGGGGGGGTSSYGQHLVIAEVTNNNDPDDMGRVKVKFASLGSNIESEWARVSTPNAGKDRGLFFMPQPGDEVVVGFELGDTRRPFVLGSLYTGKEKLPADLKDSSKREAKFGIKTPNAMLAHSTKELKLHSGEKMTVEIKKEAQGASGDFNLDAAANVGQKAGQNFKAEAGQSIDIKAGQSVTIKGSGSVTVEASGSLSLKGSTVEIQGSGAVNIKGASINLG